MGASSASLRARSPAFRGRKPSKKKWSMASPLATRAQVTALGPGMTSTGRAASSAASTRRWPGSETPGMPASLTKATRWPDATRATTDSTRLAMTFSSQRSSGTRISKRASSLEVTRVSSHSKTSAERRVSSTRGEASARLPMGVPTSDSMPPARPGLAAGAASPEAEAPPRASSSARRTRSVFKSISRTSRSRSSRGPRARPSSRGGPRSSRSGKTSRRFP